jgi:DNA-binding SARP family transcriptional activator/tetratricopeptide (TPR) repeat protein
MAARLKLLGRPAVSGLDGAELEGLPKKAFLVAAVLILAKERPYPKWKLSEQLWPGLDASRRGNNLRQLLFRIRQFETANDISLFDANAEELWPNPDIACDLATMISTDQAGVDLDADALIATYGGRLLDGLRIDDEALGRWLTNWRLQLEDQFSEAILAATASMPSERRAVVLGRAADIAPRALSLRKALMRQLIDEGKTGMARRHYRILSHVAGHGAISSPPELIGERRPAVPAPTGNLPPGSLLGRDQAGVPHLVLLHPDLRNGGVNEHIVAELVDDITVALTRLRSISVMAPYSARRVAADDFESRARLSNVDYVLRTKLPGKTRAASQELHITLVLERYATGDVIWAERLPVDPSNLPSNFAIIANSVALTLVDQIERATLQAFQVPADAGAYGHFLLGQRALQSLNLQSTRRARANFRDALALAPSFAPAHAGYAQSLVYEWVIRGRGDGELLARARSAAAKAREIDPLFSAAHQMLGRCSIFEGDFASSLEHFEKAEGLTPHHADLLCDFADTLMHNSQEQQANTKIELALKLNPFAPDAYWWASAGIKFFLGDYAGALKHLSNVQKQETIYRLGAACAAMAGEEQLARKYRDDFLSIDPDFRLSDWIALLPVKSAAHKDHYHQALTRAGFK